jgi:alkylation response protein AidB-like acyl-CoA dehydrogenase
MTSVDSVVGGLTGDQEREALVAKARELVPLLRSHAAEAERLRRMTPEVEAALRAEGLFTLTAPRRFGGREAGMRTIIEVFSELGRGCGPSAWVAKILCGGAFIASLFDDRARQEIWGENPHAAVCGSLSPSGTGRIAPGGIVLDGRWNFASGIHQASWVLASVPVGDPGSSDPDVRIALLRIADVSVEDNWHVAGMQATGSDSFTVDGLLVPDYRTISMPKALAGNYAATRPDEPVYRTALSSWLCLSLVAPVIGMARGALEHTLGLLAKGKPVGLSSYTNALDSPSIQLTMADASSLIDTAMLHAGRAADDLESAVAMGIHPDLATRARVRMDVGVAMRSCREAVDLLLNVGSASSFALSNPMQRIWRDVEAASRHAAASVGLSREIYGRALLGIEEQVSPII